MHHDACQDGKRGASTDHDGGPKTGCGAGQVRSHRQHTSRRVRDHKAIAQAHETASREEDEGGGSAQYRDDRRNAYPQATHYAARTDQAIDPVFHRIAGREEIAGGSDPNDPNDGGQGCPPINDAAIIGQWDFSQGSLAPTVGTAPLGFRNASTENQTEFLTTGSAGVSHIDGQAAQIMKVPALEEPEDGYWLPLPDLANGGGAYLNQWTLIMDLYYPEASTDEWRALIQINNSSDADLFIDPGNGIGISNDYDGEIMANRWHRVGFVVDASDGGLGIRKYIEWVRETRAAHA